VTGLESLCGMQNRPPPRNTADFLELAENCTFLDRKLISGLLKAEDEHQLCLFSNGFAIAAILDGKQPTSRPTRRTKDRFAAGKRRVEVFAALADFLHGLRRTLGPREKDRNGLSPAIRLYKRSRTTPRDIKWRASGTKTKAETPSTLPVVVSV